MTKVITYGTYDLLHYGHVRLLERAKALGDYLIVGVTADGFDMARGKINVQQSLMERMEAVRATGLADEVIVEEYEGQKIDDFHLSSPFFENLTTLFFQKQSVNNFYIQLLIDN